MLLEAPTTSMLFATPSASASKTTASKRNPPSTSSPTKPSPLPSSTTSFKLYPPSTAASLARKRSSRASASFSASMTHSTFRLGGRESDWKQT
ncbi:uncharacterized protein DS421_19g638450 [Arachis hypogaea]|uniref:Uncharacterized protein n=1 Tax=Arachis hypogaea TaxID=3818 RepID=A0A6B9V4L0_ARAHY|nr:uncharacterized protein DS421_19g638450 [Arachis hypogaea]